jgi:DNA-binding CsgD family transcriptional regulator
MKVKELPTRTSKALQRAQRRQLAVKLRLEGLTYDQIGERLGITSAPAYRLVEREIRKLAATSTGEVERLRILDTARLDAAITGIWPGVQKGDPQAVYALVAILARRAKLLGLDSPARHEVAGPEGGAINVASVVEEREVDLSCLSDQELEELERLVEKTHQCCGKENERGRD